MTIDSLPNEMSAAALTNIRSLAIARVIVLSKKKKKIINVWRFLLSLCTAFSVTNNVYLFSNETQHPRTIDSEE